MKDQVKDRINIIMQDAEHISLNDYAETAVTVLIVFVFLALGIVW
jgi:hypothetical protein